MSVTDHIKSLLVDSLCLDSYGFLDDGYLSVCTVNTYCLSLPILLLTLWVLPKLKTMEDDGAVRTRLGHFKMLSTMIFVVVVARHGPEVFNVISLTVSMASLLFVFVLSYMELNGIVVPSTYLEGYFFIYAGSMGYLLLKFLVDKLSPWDSKVRAAFLIAMTGFFNGALRNITAALRLTKKPKSE